MGRSNVSFWDLEADEAWENALLFFPYLSPVNVLVTCRNSERVLCIFFLAVILGEKNPKTNTRASIYCLESDDLSVEMSHVTYLNM